MAPSWLATTVAPCAAEFLGALLLAFAVGLWALFHRAAVWIYIAIAGLYTILVYTLEATSGAHFNPAISVCTFLSGKARMTTVLGYWSLQFSAGLLACWCCGIARHLEAEEKDKLFYPSNPVYAALSETFYTCLLCFVALNVMSVSKGGEGRQICGVAIGSAIAAGGCASCSISAAIFNPAVSIGLDVGTGTAGILHGLFCTCCDFLGAAMATVLFRFVRPAEFDDSSDADGGLLARCVSEFVGTFFVAFTVILCLVADSARTAWATIACLMSVTYALVGVSGSHFNPAVSLGMLVSGRTKLSFLDGMAYCASQFCAAALAGIVVGACGQVGGSLDEQPVPGVIMGVWQGSGTSMPWSTYVAAFVFTGVLVLVVLTLATARQPSLAQLFQGIAAASCLAAASVTMGTAFGAALNPAAALGLLVMAYLYHPVSVHLHKMLFWILIEFLGGLAAALLFRCLGPSDYDISFLPLAASEDANAHVVRSPLSGGKTSSLITMMQYLGMHAHDNSGDREVNVSQESGGASALLRLFKKASTHAFSDAARDRRINSGEFLGGFGGLEHSKSEKQGRSCRSCFD